MKKREKPWPLDSNLLVIVMAVLLGISMLFLNESTNPITFLSRAAAVKADITIDVKRVKRRLPYNWRALAQGGEEQGVRMFENVVDKVRVLTPQHIRIDHIYDFYNVVSRDGAGNLLFNWTELDATVCDIYHTGAKPFFALGYMPITISIDGSLVGQPKNWNEWSLLVQKTVERYSGTATRLCGGVTGNWFKDIYYEVWNEPDLESFGKWSLYAGEKDYKKLYHYSVMGAQKAQNVQTFFLGGPVTTAAYKNWFTVFLDYVNKNNLRIDFLSWHHYSKNTDDYTADMQNINTWLAPPAYDKYRNLPRIISEWGYDSNPNPVADTNVGAAHTVSAIRNLVEEHLELAFAFEVKDGLNPSWGIFTREGVTKPRYQALKMLNALEGYQLMAVGEGTFVKVLASSWINKIALVLVNYDSAGLNVESVPVKVTNLIPGMYDIVKTDLTGQSSTETITLSTAEYVTTILMAPNTVISLEIIKK